MTNNYEKHNSAIFRHLNLQRLGSLIVEAISTQLLFIRGVCLTDKSMSVASLHSGEYMIILISSRTVSTSNTDSTLLPVKVVCKVATNSIHSNVCRKGTKYSEQGSSFVNFMQYIVIIARFLICKRL